MVCLYCFSSAEKLLISDERTRLYEQIIQLDNDAKQQQQKFAAERTQYNDTIKTLNTQNTELNKQLTELKQQLQQHAKQHQHILIDNESYHQLCDKADMFTRLQLSYNELDKIHSTTVNQLHKLQSRINTHTPNNSNSSNVDVAAQHLH